MLVFWGLGFRGFSRFHETEEDGMGEALGIACSVFGDDHGVLRGLLASSVAMILSKCSWWTSLGDGFRDRASGSF